ncbi:MAG: C45 family peptidase [Bacteroidetes bacterium]|nr:C45 family peptidase [Bacteroidota bacterium]
MKKIAKFSGIFVLIILFACSDKSRVEYNDKLTILHLFGTPYERGVFHGKALKNEIGKITGKWINEVEDNGKTNFDNVISEFYSNTTIVDSLKKYTPELLNEVRGISDGCGIDYETILAFQLSEEIDVFLDKQEGNKCTAISVNKSGNGPAIVAQNMDPPMFLQGFPVVLHVIEGEVESYVYTFPGFIGLDGINSKRIAITCNGISMLNSSNSGLPVSFIVRKILSFKAPSDALSFINRIQHATPQAYILGLADSAICLECSDLGCVKYETFPENGVNLHTNFSIANHDFNKNYIKLLNSFGKTTQDPYFCPRFFLAYDLIVEHDYSLSIGAIKDILSTRVPDIHPINNERTYGTLIMELSETPYLIISPGRPDEVDFVKLNFK